ncbi:dihydrofolate reductase family protein [Phytoactinopolyspora halotolerans]|uniref:Deaminase n=1 Tax=Phytoactinopolyspora halotolerans TaxID=1981512 RepID=A0A6L9S5G7_9ACTN|nr:dihydrofolate reductase family protein [Phytoactinopolyspora halotolerans]NED99737.1 deaminase [Phytoactinopolyspora halotolerans]
MGKVVYSMNVSADGYIEDPDGTIGFTAPDDEIHQMWNEQTRQTSAFLFGRRLYEMMEEPWRTVASRDDASEVEKEFARIYLDTPRIVFSDTIEAVPDGVRLVRSGDAVAEAARLKEQVDGELDLGGPGLAASLIDLIDEFRLCVVPITVGGGKPFFPVGKKLNLRLAEQRVFASGAVYLCYEHLGRG